MKTSRTFFLLATLIITSNLFGAEPHKKPADLIASNSLSTETLPNNKVLQGWDHFWRIDSSLRFVDNSNVVGKQEGTTIDFGFGTRLDFDFGHGGNEWRNNLTLNANFTRQPVLDRFVKSADLLAFESLYLYHLQQHPQMGPYASFALRTSLFPDYDVRPATSTYIIVHKGGAESRSARDLKITNAFDPILLKQSVGWFLHPYRSPALMTEIRTGLSARQVAAQNALAIRDNPATPEVEVIELSSFSQMGAELVTLANGSLASDKLHYRLHFDAMLPFLQSALEPGDRRNAWDLLNLEAGVKLSFVLAAWASLDYEYRMVREPQLLDKVQNAHTLMLHFNYDLLERRKI
jgi:hypothetical protein